MDHGHPPTIDLSKLEELSGHDPVFVADVLQSIVKLLPAQLDALSASTRDRDWPGAGRLAHRIQSTTTMAGSDEFQALLASIEGGTKDPAKTSDLPGLVAQAEARGHALLTVLRATVNNLESA